MRESQANVLEELRLDSTSWAVLDEAASRAGVPPDRLLTALLAVDLPDRAACRALAIAEAVERDVALLAPLRQLEARR